MSDVTITMHPEVLARIAAKASSGLHAYGGEAVDKAKDLCPVDTGRLRDSIRVVSEDEVEILIGTDVPYAIPVEMGTAHQAAQPFLRPSIDADEAAKAVCHG